MPERNLDFVYFGGVDWGYTWQRPQQLATRLARAGRLLYVNPLGLRSPRWGDLSRLVARLRARRGRRPEGAPPPGVTVRSLGGYLPFPDRPVMVRLTAVRLRRLIRAWRPSLGGSDLVIWAGTPHPAILSLAEALPEVRLAYDCLDDFAAFHADRAQIAETEARLAARAEIVFATAEALYERMRRLNPRTIRLPNAADSEHFAPTRAGRLPVPLDIARIPGPVLGYVGEIARWFDVALVERLACEAPHWHVVLIGPAHGEAVARLRACPNVHYLGPKRHGDLPAYVHRFDVCLLPFRIDRLTGAVDPVKVYEYLAAGKPIVSTALPEVSRHGDAVTVADAASFPAAVAAALRDAADPARIARRLAIARENTWEHRAAEALGALGETTHAGSTGDGAPSAAAAGPRTVARPPGGGPR